jgi:hypothetical protein
MIYCTASLFVLWRSKLGFDPAAFNRAFGREATSSWRSGDVVKNGLRKKATTGFEYLSSLPNTKAPAEHISRLVGDLTVDQNELSHLLDLAEISFWVVIRYDGIDQPDCSFSKELLEEITSLGASLDIDIYLRSLDS